MANAYITVDKYEKLLKRVEELEHREVGVPIDIDREVNELKEDYHEIKKDVAVTDTKIDGLEARMDERFNTLDEKFTGKFDSLEKRFTMLWALQVATFLAILAIFGTLIGIMFKLFGVI